MQSKKMKFISYIYIILGIISINESQGETIQNNDFEILPAQFVY